MDDAGTVLAEHRRLEPSLGALGRWLSALPQPLTVALEATLYWHWLERHLTALGTMGRRLRRVVAKARIKVRQIDRVIEQVVEGVLERPGQQLPRKIHRQEAWVRIDVLVASHEVLDGEVPARQIRPSFHPS